jgi:hypothetical protein
MQVISILFIGYFPYLVLFLTPLLLTPTSLVDGLYCAELYYIYLRVGFNY